MAVRHISIYGVMGIFTLVPMGLLLGYAGFKGIGPNSIIGVFGIGIFIVGATKYIWDRKKA